MVNDLRYISSGVAGASSYTAEAERLIVLFAPSVFDSSFLFLLNGVLDDLREKAISQDSKNIELRGRANTASPSFLSFASLSSVVMSILSLSMAGKNHALFR